MGIQLTMVKVSDLVVFALIGLPTLCTAYACTNETELEIVSDSWNTGKCPMSMKKQVVTCGCINDLFPKLLSMMDTCGIHKPEREQYKGYVAKCKGASDATVPETMATVMMAVFQPAETSTSPAESWIPTEGLFGFACVAVLTAMVVLLKG